MAYFPLESVMAFPEKLGEDVVLHRVNKWMLRPVNLWKIAQAAVLLRPVLKPGEHVNMDTACYAVLEPEADEPVLELPEPMSIAVVHWVVGHSEFFKKLTNATCFPRDKMGLLNLLIRNDGTPVMGLMATKQIQLV